MDDHERVPENALFVCFGAMSSAGTLTGVAVLEAMKGLTQKRRASSAPLPWPLNVPKHKKSTQVAKRIIAIDGCANRCAEVV